MTYVSKPCGVVWACFFGAEFFCSLTWIADLVFSIAVLELDPQLVTPIIYEDTPIGEAKYPYSPSIYSLIDMYTAN